MSGVLPARANILFQDDFNGSYTGWTVVQPVGVYFGGPLLWEFDAATGAFSERSNIYTDSASFSPTATAPMLINDTVAGASFAFTARLTAGDDDAFGLIFGYQNETNFYRIVFTRQSRVGGFPWSGWSLDRKVNGVTTNVSGFGKPGYLGFTNTASRPFDVTIEVNGLSELTLTVVDDPTGTPVNYPLVPGQTLPSAANGRVGMFTWGMSGGTPAGFRIQNLNLIPESLAGNLAAWAAVIPPRMASHNSGISGQPTWTLTTKPGGLLQVLEESGNCLGGDDVAGQVDFTGPTLVAGSDTWSNYVVAARIIPNDDDGTGIAIRYRDATNFYRIVLRAEVATRGPPSGLSIQKNVDQIYTEVYRDNPVQYSPVPGVPYDLVADIATNTLSVFVVADPDGDARVYDYGSFTISGVSAGKVGLVSWGMSQADFDSISVQDGAALYVSSPAGSPSPGRGLNSIEPGTLVTATVGAAIVQPGVRQIPIGWTGSGSVPASGSGTNVVFTINTFSQLHWQWQTEYQLSVSNGPGGTVSCPSGAWFGAGSNVTITAQPASNCCFVGWSGDVQSSSRTLTRVMNQPCRLVANFANDSDGDGLPDDWEEAYFGAGNLTATANDDDDRDGRTNLEEYENGTNPIVADILRIEQIQVDDHAATLTVSNNTGTRYTVQRTITLPSNWADIGRLQFGNSYTSALPVGNKGFWRLVQPTRPVDVPPFVPGSWTLVVLPDTQIYAESYPELFKDQTRWIAANKDRFNIKYVLHLGDIVNVPTALNQWTNAKAAISILDGQVPYTLATGNHDHGTNIPAVVSGDRGTLINDFFPVSDYTNWPTFGGTFEPNRIENSYHLFSAGGVDWILFSLEWGPRNSPIAWANRIIANYPSRKAILVTHAYAYYDDTRYDWATKRGAQFWNPHAYNTASDPGGTNDGEELWNKLVRIYPNFVMVFSGHVLDDGLGRLSSTNDYGGVVHQMLVNYQMKTLGGEAFLRLVEFYPDGKTVQVKAYSPYYGTYKTDPQNQFQLNLQPPLR